MANRSITQIVIWIPHLSKIFFCGKNYYAYMENRFKQENAPTGLYCITSEFNGSTKRSEVKSVDKVSGGTATIDFTADSNSNLSFEQLELLLGAFGKKINNASEFNGFVDSELNDREEISYLMFDFDSTFDVARFLELDNSTIDRVEMIDVPSNVRPKKIDESIVINGYLDDVYLESVVSDAPDKIGDYEIPEVIRSNWDLIEANLASDESLISFISLTGGQGSGKTTFPRELAKFIGYDFVQIDSSDIESETDWWTRREIAVEKGSSVTTYHNHAVTEALLAGKNVVILIDEINRIQHDKITNNLLKFLDERRLFSYADIDNDGVHFLNMGRFDGKAIVVSAMNKGANYTGTGMPDTALMGRADASIIMPTPSIALMTKIIKKDSPKLDDKTVSKIVDILNAFIENTEEYSADYEIGVRDGKKIAKRAEYRGERLTSSDLQQFFISGIINKFEDENAQVDLLGVLQKYLVV